MAFLFYICKNKNNKMNDPLTRKGKYLALLLRHQPEKAGLTIMRGGWVNIKDILKNTDYTMSELEEIVRIDEKKRYSFSKDKTKIRANQGHSVDVEMDYELKEPPKVLYHGTVYRFVSSIMRTGIQKQKRDYVHLSDNIETAKIVGQRRGDFVILTIDSESMHKDGYKLYMSENGVWLTDNVPVKYIKIE